MGVGRCGGSCGAWRVGGGTDGNRKGDLAGFAAVAPLRDEGLDPFWGLKLEVDARVESRLHRVVLSHHCCVGSVAARVGLWEWRAVDRPAGGGRSIICGGGGRGRGSHVLSDARSNALVYQY